MFEIILFTIVFVVALAGVEIFRRWSLRREIFDVPNERSSHHLPTPRGGGSVIVLTILTAYIILSLFKIVEFQTTFLIGSFLIAFISWLDDLFTISFVFRFIVHSVSAILIVLNVGYFQVIDIPFLGIIDFGLVGAVFTFLWIVWMTNAYNFMDGIDGIAGIQAVIAGMGWYFVGSLLGMANSSIVFLIISAACLGFLIHNWQPAKIFMGDVGSAFLGFCFAVVPFLKSNINTETKAVLPYIAVSFVWLFIFDTVFTFLKRSIKRQKVWEAHREHFYQQLVINNYSHQVVTLSYGIFTLINSLTIFWLIRLGHRNIIYILIPITLEAVLIYLYVTTINKSLRLEKQSS